MCLQDVKMRKGYEVRGRTVTGIANNVTPSIMQAGNRRLISFAWPGNVLDLVSNNVIITWFPTGLSIAIGHLTVEKPYFAIDILRYGSIVYGPFNFTLPDGSATTVAISELLDNTGEENSI